MQHSQLRRLFDGAPPPTLSSPSTASSSIITSIPVVVVGHREEPSSGLEALKNKHVRDKGTRPHRDSVDDLALLSLLTSSSTSSSDTCGGAPSAAGAAGAGLGKENRRSSSVRTQRVSSAVHRDTTPHKRKSRGSAIKSPSVAPRQPLTPSTHHHQHKPQPPQATESAAYETCDVERPAKVEAKAKAKQQQPHTPPLAGERRVRRRPKKSPAVSNEDLRREIAGTLRSHLGRDVSPAAAAATPKRKASSLAGVERNRLGYAHPPSSSSSSSTSSSSRGVGPLSASSGCVRLRNQRSLDGLLGQPLRLRAPCGPVEGEHGRQHHLRLQLHVPRLDVGRADHDTNDDDGEWEACNEQPAKLNGRAAFIETAAKGREAGLRFIALHPRSGLAQSDAVQQQQAEAPHVAVGAGRRRRSRSLTDVRKALREGGDSASSAHLAPHGTDGKERARRKKAGRRRSSLMKVFDSLRNKLAGPEDSEEDGEAQQQQQPHEERTDKHSHKQQPSAALSEEETAGGLRLACPTSFTQLLAQGGTLPGVVAGSVFANWNAHQNRLEDPGLVGSLVLAVRHWGFTPEHLFTAFLEAYYFPPLLSAPEASPRSLYTPAAPALLPFRRKLASFLVEWVDVAYEADFSGRALGQKLKVLVNEVMVRHGLKEEANAVRNRIWAASIRHPRSLTAALRLRSPSTAGAPSSPAYHPAAAAATVQSTATTAAAPGAERLAKAVKGGKAEVATPSQSSRQLRPQASVLVRTAPATPASSSSSTTMSQQTQTRMGRVASERMIERIPTSGKVKPMNVLQVRSRVIAQQLMRIDYELLGKVDLREFTDMAFTKPELSPNINLLIEQCNKISYWVCSQVLTLKKFSHQVKALRKFINIAYKCLKMGNFASLMALSLGLNLSPLTRLEDLWEEAYRDGKCAAKMRKVNTFLPLVGNCKEYREVLARHMERLARLDEATRSGADASAAAPPASPRQQQQQQREAEHEQPAEEAEGEEQQQVRYPLIPFLAVYMKDLTFINDGNPHLMRGGHLNVDKMLRWGRILREIQLLQRQPCPIEVDELVHNLLININFISEETLWNISSSLKLQHSRD